MSKRHALFTYLFLVPLLFILSANNIYSQTTGKIAGTVIDASTGEGMAWANVMLEGTTIGTATDFEGHFVILNVSPGKYTVMVKMLGYQTIKMTDIVVSVNRTTNLEFEMSGTSVELGEVVVSASKIANKKDQTASIKNISSEEIDMLPVESIDGVVGLQAGIVGGHFRGGRSGESVTLVDGIEVSDAFRGNMISLETEVVQDLEVITGTFNAEYGNAMSGIINMVTKDGSEKFEGSATVELGNFYTSNDDIFIGLSPGEIDREKDFKLFLSGPIISDKLGFVANARYRKMNEYLSYIRRYNPIDLSDYTSQNPNQWWTEQTGDSSFVPSYNERKSLFAKLSFKPITSIRTSLSATYEDRENLGYNHEWKYNPDGVRRGYSESASVVFQFNHTLSNSLFYLAQASYLVDDNYSYLFEDPNDSGWIHEGYRRNANVGFYTGGQQFGYSKQKTNKFIGKLAFTWQINKEHLIKVGGDYVRYDIDVLSTDIRNKYYNNSMVSGEIEYDSLTNKVRFVNFVPELVPDSVLGKERYNHSPTEFSAYIQDKMEFDDMVINLGLRYDYYNPNSVYPSNYRNPGNQLYFEDQSRMSTYIDAEAQSQLSPRLGLSYQLGGTSLLRFSYGHFFQRPSFRNFYSNSSFLLSQRDFESTMGNPNLKAEKTISYELGLWQNLTPEMSLEVAVYYKDIYNLLTIIPIATYNQVRYGLYSNKDYGNVKGLEVTWGYNSAGFMTELNYTLQYTKGVADNPFTNFNRAGDQLSEYSVLIPLSWDQRHTLNITAGYSTKNFGITSTAYYNSGYPYTWAPLPESQLTEINLFPNNAPKPSRFNLDIRAHYTFWKSNNFALKLNLLIYNLLDNLNERNVYSSTGRAYTSIVKDSDLSQHHSDFNTYYDRIENPSMFHNPRKIKLGIQLKF